MKRPLALAALVTAIVMMGRLLWGDSPPKKDFPAGEALTLTGRVYDVQERDGYDAGQLWIYVNSVTIQQQGSSRMEADLSYHLICQTDDSFRPRMGSLIQVTGQFEPFSHATNPGQFDERGYYNTLNIGGILKQAKITAAGSSYSLVKQSLYTLKKHWKERLYQCFPEKEASILSAMLLGDRTQLDKTTKQLYMDNGIIHILSISGLHITMIGMSLYRLLRRLGCPVRISAICGGVLLILYGILTGMGVSAVRAISMYLVRMLGLILGRSYDMLTALGFAGILMLTGKSAYLGNAGFLLSFCSLVGIGILLPVLSAEEDERKEMVYGDRIKISPGVIVKYIRNAMAPGLAVTLMTLPVQLFFYYEVPVYSLVINLLVLPFVNALMVTGMIVMMIPGVSLIGRVDVLILSGYEWLCKLFQELPFHTWNPGAPQIRQVIVYYILLIAAVYWRAGKKKSFVQNSLRTITVMGAVLLLGISLRPKLTVTFLDVGQGDGICVRVKDQVYLFDCGSSSEKQIGKYILLPYLKQQGIRRISGVFLSHPDNDHISGILELLSLSKEEGICIDHLVLPDIEIDRRKAEFAQIFQAIDAMEGKKPSLLYMGRGTRWENGGVSFSCLHPPSGSDLFESNAYSQCFLVEYGSFSMLLTGDVEGEGERLLLQQLERRGVERVDLLKVAHHGSDNSTKKELLDLIKPQIAVISCGENNPYGHPHEELVDRLEGAGSKIYATPKTGAVTVRVNGKRLKVQCFLP